MINTDAPMAAVMLAGSPGERKLSYAHGNRAKRTAVGIAFLLTTLVIVVTPGPGVIYTVAAAISRGHRASLIAVLGCTLGIIPHLMAAITGLAALLYASSLAFQTLKYVGVAYLIFLAWKAYRDDSRIVIDELGDMETPVPVWSVIVKAILINLFNPKLTIFFFAFLPQFVHPDEPNAVACMLGLGSVFMLVTLLVFAGYGAFAARVRSLVLDRPRTVTWMRRIFAGSYVVLAGRLAVSER
jgi:threonine/homoserine/homoserine lactone efflux protein